MDWRTFATHIRHFNAAERSRIERAYAIGEKAHEGQKRKSGEPYFTHPIAVARMLLDMGADGDTVIAALLHDTIEDTSLTLDVLEREFGKEVTALIDGLTKLEATDLGGKPTLNEQTETLRKMFGVMQQDVRIMVIKLVDRLHNLQTVEYLPSEKQVAFAQETMEAYVRIADRLCMQDLRDEMEALCLALLEPDGYQKMAGVRKRNEQLFEKLAPGMRDKMHKMTRVPFQAVFEPKSWGRTRAQVGAEDASVTGLAHFAIAFVCKNTADCYAILGALHQQWRRETLSFQDFINSPLINGYKGLHTTVIMEDGTRVRCKIRTEDMQEYARRGITTRCFDKKAAGFLEYLPWTHHLSEVASDTKQRSEDFWESLQNDILGESIIVHGPGDESVAVPRNATALDAAFFLFRDMALRLQSVKVNGMDARWDEQIKTADSVSGTFAKSKTVEREWLQKVNTGFAAAMIRTAFATESHQKRTSLGKKMLQQALDEHGLGFLEEFNPDSFVPQLKQLGYDSLPAAFEAIADRHLDPRRVVEAVFQKRVNGHKNGHRSRYAVRVDIQNDEPARVEHTVKALQRTGSLRRLNVKQGSYKSIVRSSMLLTFDEREGLSDQLQSGENVRVRIESMAALVERYVSIVVLILIWGLDPVLTKLMLTHVTDPVSFTIIRADTVFIFALIVLVLSMQKRGFLRIPIFSPSLWAAGIAFFLMSLLTYITLAENSPTLYNTVLRGNALLLALPFLVTRRQWNMLAVGCLIVAATIASLAFTPITTRGILLCTGILVIFNIYTLASSRFQQEARVLARFPQFFFATSTITAALGMLLAVFNPPELPPVHLTMMLVGYCVGFVGVPYILFYALTRNIGYASLSPWVNMTLVVTVAVESLLIDTANVLPYIPAALLLLAGSFMASSWARTRLTSDLSSARFAQARDSSLQRRSAT